MKVREVLTVCELTTNRYSGGVSTQHNAETHTHTLRAIFIMMVLEGRNKLLTRINENKNVCSNKQISQNKPVEEHERIIVEKVRDKARKKKEPQIC